LTAAQGIRETAFAFSWSGGLVSLAMIAAPAFFAPKKCLHPSHGSMKAWMSRYMSVFSREYSNGV